MVRKQDRTSTDVDLKNPLPKVEGQVVPQPVSFERQLHLMQSYPGSVTLSDGAMMVLDRFDRAKENRGEFAIQDGEEGALDELRRSVNRDFPERLEGSQALPRANKQGIIGDQFVQRMKDRGVQEGTTVQVMVSDEVRPTGVVIGFVRSSANVTVNADNGIQYRVPGFTISIDGKPVMTRAEWGQFSDADPVIYTSKLSRG